MSQLPEETPGVAELESEPRFQCPREFGRPDAGAKNERDQSRKLSSLPYSRSLSSAPDLKGTAL